MDTIVCPHCGKDVQITKALAREFEGEIVKREREKFEEELEKTKKTAFSEVQKKLAREFEEEMKRMREDTEEEKERNKKLIEQITTLTRDLRDSKREKDEAKLEMEKKLSEEEEKIRIDTQKKVEEAMHLKMLEKDKQLSDTLKELEETKRKIQQGSQQLQGETFELEFERILKEEFPNDITKEVAKGVKGGDLVQEVWDRNGNSCGTILWELKNTKTWSELWIDKLKGDQRAITADYAVIVSEAVPKEVESAKFYKNVWVTKRNFIVGLASALRMNLIQISMAKRAMEGKNEKKDILYSYLSGTEFRLRLEAIVDAFSNMQTEIEKEKRYFSHKWARDEKNIRQIIHSTYSMHGDLKSIVGAALPQIKGIDMLEDGTNDNSNA